MNLCNCRAVKIESSMIWSLIYMHLSSGSKLVGHWNVSQFGMKTVVDTASDKCLGRMPVEVRLDYIGFNIVQLYPSQLPIRCGEYVADNALMIACSAMSSRDIGQIVSSHWYSAPTRHTWDLAYCFQTDSTYSLNIRGESVWPLTVYTCVYLEWLCVNIIIYP